jgi:hypothetical protein
LAYIFSGNEIFFKLDGGFLMKKLPLFGLLLLLGAIFVVTGCGPSPTTSPSTTTVSAIPPVPVEIISVAGPMPQYIDGKPVYNPGGPVVEITLKNVTGVPFVSLNATLKTNRDYYCTFDVTVEKPWLPGQVISARQGLIGGGFSDNVYYPLTINAILQNGDFFHYSKQVIITPPTTTAQEPVALVSIGTIPPMNPGGPTIEIVLKNVSAEPVLSLTASLGINRAGPSAPITYSFNVTSTDPLQPGKTVSSKLNIIGGGFDTEASYPLTINGTLLSGQAFGFTLQVKISAPE